MRVNATSFTVAEYCQQMMDRAILVNRNYQRSPAVWPPAARSFLIDSMLNGFPVPKLSLYQRTDLVSRKTIKEIVDGQQRSQAILDFFNDKLRITSKGRFQGRTYSGLEPEDKQAFLSYQLSVDVFVDATESDIRELFRRVNSYNVPLNPQEKRHATYQGKFKWFLFEASNAYSQFFKDLGTFSESQMARMDDSRFTADFFVGVEEGIVSASEAKIEGLYKKYDSDFPREQEFSQRLRESVDGVLELRGGLGEELTKKYQLYCLMLALTHLKRPIVPLQPLFQSGGNIQIDPQQAQFRLSELAQALTSKDGGGDVRKQEFISASSKTTDRKDQREKRFVAFCTALS